jgi:hypothetical protein
MTDHLTREQQLLYLDGELAKRAMRAAGQHLQSCWACRTELEHLQEDIGVIHDAQKFVALPSLPPPLRPWPPLEPRLASAALGPRWLALLRIRPIIYLARRPVPLLAAAAGMLLVAALLWFSPPSVSAKGILRRALEADNNRMVPPANHFVRQKVRVTSTERGPTSTRVGQLNSWRSGKGAYWQIAKTDAVALNLQRHYQAENVSDLPLSTVSYQSWSERTGTEGEVARAANTLEVKFATAHPPHSEGLESMSLRVRPQDWHVTEMELDFTDVRFDLAEEDFTILPRSEVPAEVLAELEPPVRSPEPPVLSAKIKPSLDLDETEMDVRYTLHQIGADLGEPIEVVRNSSSQLVVRAWGAPPARQELLTQLLQNKSHVHLELQPPERNTDVGATTPQVLEPVAPLEVDPAREADDQRLAKWFGSPEVQEDFTRSVLVNSTGLLARLYALKQLADRWPPESESRLSNQLRAKLATMIQEDASAAAQHCLELKLIVKPLLDDFAPANEETPPSAVPRGWQDASIKELESAKDLDRLLRSLLTTNKSGAALNDSLPQIRQDLAETGKEIASLPASKP